MPSKASASVIGLAPVEVYDSMSWHSASMPDAAVTAGGASARKLRVHHGHAGEQVLAAEAGLEVLLAGRR